MQIYNVCVSAEKQSACLVAVYMYRYIFQCLGSWLVKA